MGKKIQISESDLHSIILEATKKVLNEMAYNNGSPEEMAIKEIVDYINQYYDDYNGEDFPPLKDALDACGFRKCGNDCYGKGDIYLRVFFDKGDACWCVIPYEEM